MQFNNWLLSFLTSIGQDIHRRTKIFRMLGIKLGVKFQIAIIFAFALSSIILQHFQDLIKRCISVLLIFWHTYKYLQYYFTVIFIKIPIQIKLTHFISYQCMNQIQTFQFEKDDEILQYQSILKKRLHLREVLQTYEAQSIELKREIRKAVNMKQLIDSQQYQEQITSILGKFQKLQGLKQQLQALQNSCQYGIDQIEVKKIEHQIMEGKKKQLDYSYSLQQQQKIRINKDYRSLEQFFEQLISIKQQNERKIIEYTSQSEENASISYQEQSRRRLIQKYAMHRESNEMIDEEDEDIKLIQQGQYFPFIYKQGIQLKKLSCNLHQISQQLVESNITYNQLKVEKDLAQKQFNIYYQSHELDSEESLKKEEQLLDKRLDQLERLITIETANENNINDNYEINAKKRALTKTKTWAKQKQAGITKSKKYIEQLLMISTATRDERLIEKLNQLQVQFKSIEAQGQQIHKVAEQLN